MNTKKGELNNENPEGVGMDDSSEEEEDPITGMNENNTQESVNAKRISDHKNSTGDNLSDSEEPSTKKMKTTVDINEKKKVLITEYLDEVDENESVKKIVNVVKGILNMDTNKLNDDTSLERIINTFTVEDDDCENLIKNGT